MLQGQVVQGQVVQGQVQGNQVVVDRFTGQAGLITQGAAACLPVAATISDAQDAHSSSSSAPSPTFARPAADPTMKPPVIAAATATSCI